jgi:hypothetical protein
VKIAHACERAGYQRADQRARMASIHTSSVRSPSGPSRRRAFAPATMQGQQHARATAGPNVLGGGATRCWCCQKHIHVCRSRSHWQSDCWKSRLWASGEERPTMPHTHAPLDARRDVHGGRHHKHTVGTHHWVLVVDRRGVRLHRGQQGRRGRRGRGGRERGRRGGNRGARVRAGDRVADLHDRG